MIGAVISRMIFTSFLLFALISPSFCTDYDDFIIAMKPRRVNRQVNRFFRNMREKAKHDNETSFVLRNWKNKVIIKANVFGQPRPKDLLPMHISEQNTVKVEWECSDGKMENLETAELTGDVFRYLNAYELEEVLEQYRLDYPSIDPEDNDVQSDAKWKPPKNKVYTVPMNLTFTKPSVTYSRCDFNIGGLPTITTAISILQPATFFEESLVYGTHEECATSVQMVFLHPASYFQHPKVIVESGDRTAKLIIGAIFKESAQLLELHTIVNHAGGEYLKHVQHKYKFCAYLLPE